MGKGVWSGVGDGRPNEYGLYTRSRGSGDRGNGEEDGESVVGSRNRKQVKQAKRDRGGGRGPKCGVPSRRVCTGYVRQRPKDLL